MINRVGAMMLLGACCLVLVGLTLALPSNYDWISFKREHGKVYESRLVESMRRSIFERRKQYIEQFNAEESHAAGYRLKLNHLSDKSDSEIKTLLGFRYPPNNNNVMLRSSPDADHFVSDLLNDSTEVPDQVDWRKVPGRVSRVKDQGHCGSCWAFASVGVLEGQVAVRNSSKRLVELSEQNLVDCSKENYGCNGGFMKYALDFVGSEGGIDDEESYPYDDKYSPEVFPCRFNPNKIAFSDKGGALLPEGDEEALKKVVAKYGPVSVAIDAGGNSFQFYESGVHYNQTCQNDQKGLDHAVLVVGYGTDLKHGDYWIVKNSWSYVFGDQGYIKMARNKNNNCGIATVATIATF